MKRFFLSATAALFVAACNGPANNTAADNDTSNLVAAKTTVSAMPQQQRNMQAAMDGVRAFPTGNVDETFKDVVQNSVDYNDGSMPPVHGLDSIKAMDVQVMKDWKTAFPDIRIDNLGATANGDTVMVWGDYKGTWKGNFMGQKPTGKSFSVSQVDRFVFNSDGKILEHRMTPNTFEVARQIGMK